MKHRLTRDGAAWLELLGVTFIAWVIVFGAVTGIAKLVWWVIG